MRDTAKELFNTTVYVLAGVGLVLLLGHLAVSLDLTNTQGKIESGASVANASPLRKETLWKEGVEWQTFKEAILKDRDQIIGAAFVADISPRLIFSLVAVEQLRLFHTERAAFKEIFAPLRILGAQSQFSWGVAGIKQETAKDIENHLKNSASEFYPGKKYEHLLDFQTENRDQERFDRISNERDHSYGYLYAALFTKEIESQWKRRGFPIENNVGVLATLYNIGFRNSNPKAYPEIGGSEINIGGVAYTFGGLAHDIYYSEELIQEFPQ